MHIYEVYSGIVNARMFAEELCAHNTYLQYVFMSSDLLRHVIE